MKKEEMSPDETPPAEPPDRVLVVDDNAAIVRLNAQTLIRSGYDVDTAPDGEVGLQALQAKQYDLLITDNEMPKVSGVEMVNDMYDKGIAVPVIMATGALPVFDLAKHPRLKAIVMMLKPFTPRELLNTVKKVLGAMNKARHQP